MIPPDRFHSKLQLKWSGAVTEWVRAMSPWTTHFISGALRLREFNMGVGIGVDWNWGGGQWVREVWNQRVGHLFGWFVRFRNMKRVDTSSSTGTWHGCRWWWECVWERNQWKHGDTLLSSIWILVRAKDKDLSEFEELSEFVLLLKLVLSWRKALICHYYSCCIAMMEQPGGCSATGLEICDPDK